MSSTNATRGDARSRKPFTTYPGGKDAAGSVQNIMLRLPAHSVYVEAFLGNGAVLRAKPPALRSIGIDRSRRVIAAWRKVNWPGLELMEGDAIDLVPTLAEALPADAAVYLDPPYPHDTRSRRRLYEHELTRRDHGRLLAMALALPCGVAISSYANPMYDEALANWRRYQWRAMTRGGPRVETLWVKPSPAAFNPRPYVGTDYRDRLRIKRKADRWARMYDAMPAHEQDAVLAALLEQRRGQRRA